MAIFFLMIGLELEREVYIGELSKIKDAILPISGALGGMLFPALIFFLFNAGTKTQSGIGIPMATDIAFALGILSLVGNKVPNSLKVFLTALAVIDDLGAIIVIALFYTKTLYFANLMISLAIFAGLLVLNRMKVYQLWIYLVVGVFMWYFMLNSGVHATITGVLLAFAIPFQDGTEKTISYKLQHFLHKPVVYIILPLFALCNTAIVIGSDWVQNFSEDYSLGIIFGLVFGKPIGIVLVSLFVVTIGIAKLPKDMSFNKLLGAGFLGGIGFTMSIFISLLAFEDAEIINNAKFMILVASLLSGIIGFLWLKKTCK
jgi:NhaA family Na+:H+ antiporter